MHLFSKVSRSFLASIVLPFFCVSAFGQEMHRKTATPPVSPRQEQPGVTGTAALAPSSRSANFVISAGDLIEVSVYGIPELSQKTRVNGSGELYMPLVGYTHVEGLTIADAQALIEKRLVDGGYVNSPHVSLFTTEYAQGVSVMGEVNKPGIYPRVGSHSVMDLI